MIRILLADDQTLLRRGLAGMFNLTADLRVVAEAADGEAALEELERHQVDVAVLDVRMPKKTGIEVLEMLRLRGSVLPAILLTTFDDDVALLAGVRAGARGWMLKDVAFERLAEAVREVAAGGTALLPAITERAVRSIAAAPPEFESLDLPDRLTPRETEILRLMAGGYSNREIGETLFMGEGTVKNHTSRILSKLGVRDRTRAVLKGIELGYV
ncbi:MAG: response regulator transcription factor [Candidatus Eisenbacteria bacterium]|nr:response regulator transcription factor [Candidatus Eisenbacteria bacterium]MCC7141358.1 response regulator transcription factor [Candidatus Eisenbacteria bacterium]